YMNHEIDDVVLGRPVRFADDDVKNREAVRNVRDACYKAGFTDVAFQYEPVAAAYGYALDAGNDENILIFDFGGGTFDVTIVNVQNRQARVLGLGGVPVGGSDFDKSMMYEQIAPHFGKGCQVGHGYVVPDNTFLELLNWQTIVNLNRDRRFLKNLGNWIFYADDAAPFKALQRLVKENHGFAIFQEIEKAKKSLSDVPEAIVAYEAPEVFDGEGAIDIQHRVTRREFEMILRHFSDRIAAALDDTLTDAGLRESDIQHVVRVGGSSKIPFFHAMLAKKFGAGKLRMKDEFKNVAAGLAVDAFQHDKPPKLQPELRMSANMAMQPA
ncbi:MAG: Hsp70 family protein, partial [bacterium]|nr:Hsp70 family protein [bacterium]